MENGSSHQERAGALELERAGARLYTVTQGRGAPVVYLHGGFADHRASLVHVGALARTRWLITPDVRAAGRSHYAGALSWELLADDVAALLDHLGLERAVVGGMSAGSAIALRFALRHPDRAGGLVLAAPVYAGADRGLTPAQRAAFAAMDAAGREAQRVGVSALRPLFEALPEAIRARALEMVASFDPASVAATARFLASGVQPIAALDVLATIATPTLVIPGADAEHPAELAT
ncbi:MAG: alpha/beta hydrolase, partial [Myxococcales bacterium]|nr:alpha/beta hydrolase [Myxococcales bacterium]